MYDHSEQCLQERYAPRNACFGCGPANEHGLKIRSFPVPRDSKDPSHHLAFELVAQWQPQKRHEAFENMLNGGIVGALLDCHCNWTATYHLLLRDQLDQPPCTVTANYSISLHHPTPTQDVIHLRAHVDRCDGRRVWVKGTLLADGQTTATCDGLFVSVKEGHPAFHRW